VGISFFKDDIHPSWEDPRNQKGSEFQLEIKPDLYAKVDEIFQELLLVVVGQSEPSSTRVPHLHKN
jgi:hypothetical protein